jgi:hypothetical protein
MSLTEIDHLLERAQARNLECGVTGVLLCSDGQFMQYIEGPAASMSRTYGVIKADRNHHCIIELLRGEIAEREFPEWAVAFRSNDVFSSPLQPAGP